MRIKHLLCLALFVLAPRVSQSQNFDRGFVPYESYQSSGLETVNLANGNLLLHIPIISYPQRGDLPPFTLSLRYNNPRWVIQYNSYVALDGTTHYAAYWQHDGSSTLIARDNTYVATYYNYTPDPGYATSAAHAVDSSGAHHILETTGDPNIWNSLRESIDASGLRVDTGHVTNGAGSMGYVPVVEPDGVTHVVPYVDPTIVPLRTLQNGFLDTTQDPNGNHITPQVTNPGSTNYTVTGWVDSVGRFIPASHQPLSPNGSPPSFCETLNFPAVNGGTAPMTFCYSVIPQQSPFSVPWAGFASANNSTWLSSVTLPNGTAWLFGYNSFGELSSITLPTGGVISYTWTNSALCNSTINNPAMPNSTDWFSSTPVVCDRVVATRTFNANDGTSPATWRYSVGYPNSPYTRVTDPAGNDTLHTFSSSYAQSPYETTTQYFSGPQSNNILLKRVDQQYQNLNYDFTLCPAYDGQADGLTHGPAVVPLSTTTTWPSGQVSQTTFVYDSGAVFNVVDAGQATHSCPLIYGSLVQQSNYDFGSGTPGSLIRQTSMLYVWQNNSGFLNANLLDRVASVTVRNGNLNQVANTTYGYDENNGSPQGVLGNQTSITRWLNGGISPKFQTVYNAQGMPTQRIDANLNVTTITYDSTGSFPSKIQLPDTAGVHHIDNYVYDGNTGLPTSHTGQNGEVTTYAYDNMRRLTGITYPTGGGTESYSYSDQTPFPSFTYTRQIDSSTNFVEVGVVNGLGRPNRTQITSDPAGVDTTDTAYDILGRVASVSNPYRSTSDTTYGLTSYQYDALGRITQVTKQDGSISSVSYADNCTTATDEAGKGRKSCSDGLGRLTNVREDPSGLNYETDYQYDALGNLLRVDQKGSAPTDSTQWRTRLFTYDSLSRLLTANNPESGTISYTYDADGNVLNKTDARGVVATNTYDQLNRRTYTSYSDGITPYVQLTYDRASGNGIGRLTHAWRGSTSTFPAGTSDRYFFYDSMGRVNSLYGLEPSNMNGRVWSVVPSYDLAGNMTSLTYPDGQVVNYAYDSASRALSATDGGNNTPYVSSATYLANGALNQWSHLSNIHETVALNKRLQVGSQSADNLGAYYFNKTYNYGTQGANNGNIQSITNSLDSSRSQSFVYDSLNRLTHAENAGTNCAATLPDGHTKYWGNNYVYDAWGNLYQKNVTKCSAENLQATVATNNRLTGYTYDPAGNMTNDSFHSYTFDGESRILQMDSGAAAYLYGIDGQRVRKDSSNGTWTEYIEFGGNIVAERSPLPLSSSMLSQSGLSGYNPGVIVDGSTACCGWHTDSATAGAWLQVDLGAGNAQPVLLARIYAATANYAGNWTIQYSDNGSTWGNAATNFIPSLLGWNFVSWSSVGGHRYWRLYLTNTPGPGAWLNELQLVVETNYIYFNGKRTARRDPSGTVHYYLSDHLGSTSMVVSASGTVENESEYYPWGGELKFSANDSGNHYKFTGKERDNESGLDYFGARYYGNTLGRFTGVDPIWVKGDRLIDPQRLNLFAYGRNNPLKFSDPTGMDIVMGKCEGGDAQKCFDRALQGLRKEDRSHVHLVAGDDKNGFKKGEYGITVDKDYHSDSQNFNTLQGLANDHSAVAALNTVGPKVQIEGNVAVKDKNGNLTLKPLKEVYGMNLTLEQGWYGQTFYQDWGPGHLGQGDTYSKTGRTEVYVGSDYPVDQIVAGTYHELTHVMLADFGRKPGAGDHGKPGVNDKTDAAEAEARKNMKDK